MLSPLYLKLYARKGYPAIIHNDKAFFQLCCEHFGFLLKDYKFEVLLFGRNDRGEVNVAAVFFNEKLRVRIAKEYRFLLPILSVSKASENKLVFDLSELAVQYGFENNNGSYYEESKQLRSLDELAEIAFSQKYNDAVADRMANFSRCVRENLDKFLLLAD
jgi:virulence-associated protein VapD